MSLEKQLHATISIRPPPPGHPPKRFFAVSILKLILMSVCTFGLYEFYWFYEHWDEVKQQTRENLSPFWRAIFAPLFCYSLFTRIKATSSAEGVRSRYPPGLDAFIWIALVATGYYEFLIIPFLTFLPLVHVQRQVNDLHRKVAPLADKNARFAGLNIAAIAVGGGLILTASVFSVRSNSPMGDLQALHQAIAVEFDASESLRVDLERGVSVDGVEDLTLTVGFANFRVGGLPDDERRDFARSVAEFVRDHYAGYGSVSTVAIGFVQITEKGPVTTRRGQGLYPFSMNELGVPRVDQDSVQIR